MITYMDRAANGSARDAIMIDLNANRPADQQLDKNDFFLVLMAFQLAYALFEIPSGWLGDTRGPRVTLLRVVIWWSSFVALTGFTGTDWLGIYIGFTALFIMQFLFGVGEAGAFPNIAKALYNWFPATDRGFAKSAVWMSARCMGGLTPLLWVTLVGIVGLSWRQAMWLFAAVAGFWCVIFYLTFRNRPEEHPDVNVLELAAINRGRSHTSTVTSIPWRTLFTSRNLWCVCIMYVVTNFCWYFLMYNHPGMMKAEYATWNESTSGQLMLALLSGAPLLVGMIGCLLGGIISDWYLKRTGDRAWARRWPGMIGYGGAGLAYFAAAYVKYSDPTNLWIFAGLLILMGFMNDLIMAPAWAVCQDIGQSYAATVSGTMNMFGNLVGAVSGIFITGMIEKNYPADKILICFIMYGSVYFVGVIAWRFIDASRPIVPDSSNPVTSTI
jgi:MFS transporter, ACS family, glucarate transporter